MSAKTTVSEKQKRSVECPQCGARSGNPCRSSRIPGPNSFGGGWGGPPDLDRAHDDRRRAFLETLAPTVKRCRACDITVTEANAGQPECPNTNNREHDFPGMRLHVMAGNVEVK